MTKRDTRLKGLHPLAYMGVNPEATPLLFTNNRPPTVNDKTFNIGTLWVDRETLGVWVLVDLSAGVATWIRFATSGNAAFEFIADIGIAVPAASILDVIGDGASTETLGAVNDLSIDFINGANGEVFIGDGVNMAPDNITSTGGTIIITNGANTINIEDTGLGGVIEIDGDTGTAAPVLNNIQMLGDGLNISTQATGNQVIYSLNSPLTIAGTLTISLLPAGVMQTDATGLVTSNNGTAGQVLIGGGAAPAWANITSTGTTLVITNGANTINIENPATAGITDIDGDAGTAVPVAGNVQILGGTNITTAAAGDTVTINLNDNVTLTGTLTISPLPAGGMRTDPAGGVSSSNGSNGQIFIGGGAAPAWNNITSLGGTIDITNGANTINLEEVGGASVDDTTFLQAPDPLGGEGGGFIKPFGDATTVDLGYSTSSTTFFDPGGNITDDRPFEYTAPLDGKYNFPVCFRFYGPAGLTADTEIKIIITTSNRTYTTSRHEPLQTGILGGWIYESETLDLCLDLDASDTFKVKWIEDWGFADTWYYDRLGGVITDVPSFGSGFFVGA